MNSTAQDTIDPHSVDSRQRLIRAAAEVFMEEGYRASMDRIAARAGVARQTVYNHFSSKDDLFSEVANLSARSVLVTLEGDVSDLRGQLLDFAAALRQLLLSEEGLAIYRTLAAEVPRFTDLAQAFYDKGPAQTLSRLTEFLAQAMNQGVLRRENPVFAAEMLISMLDSFDRTRRLFSAATPGAEPETERVARIIDTFLRAYAPAH